MILNAAVVAGQGLICGLTAAGWGYWVFRSCGRPADRAGTFGLLCALAGWCAGALLLQDLLIANIRLQWSSPCAGAVAAAGLVAWARDRPSLPAYRLGWPAIALFFGVFGFQSAGVIHAGPANYYGYARQDQVNYVSLTQFLLEKPYSTTFAEVGLHPWMVKGIETKTERIGQCVANGYLAGVTGQDAKSSYGATLTGFLGLAALAVYGCLRSWNIPALPAALAGAWAGLLPALTHTQLEGFFSQAATLFCFAGIAWAVGLAREKPAAGLTTAVLILGFLLSAYTEEFVIGLAVTVALLLPCARSNWRWWAGATTAAIFGPWLLVAPLATQLGRFVHYQTAAATRGAVLAELEPRAGTWRGWNELFLAAPARHPLLLTLAALAGSLILATSLLGILLGPGDTRWQRAVLAALPIAVLACAIGVTWPVFPAYVFGKLTVSFAPLVVLLFTAATVTATRRWPTGAPTLLIVLAGCAGWSSWTKLAVVFRGGEGLATVNIPGVQAVYRELEAHPERTYLLEMPNAVLGDWLAYHARHAPTYSLFPLGGIAARPYAFMGPPPAGQEVWEVGWTTIRRRSP